MSFAQMVYETNPYRSFASGIQKGPELAAQYQNAYANSIKNRYLSKSLQHSMKAAELKNTHDSIVNQFLAPQLQSQNTLRQQQAAQMAFQLQHPLLKAGGTAGQVGATRYLTSLSPSQSAQPTATQTPMKLPMGQTTPSLQTPQSAQVTQPLPSDRPIPSSGTPQSQANLILNDMMQKQDYMKKLAAYRSAQTAAMPFALLPSTTRTAVLSKARGTGKQYLQAAKELTGGKSLKQLADEQGIDLGKTMSVFPPTTSTESGLQKRALSVNAIDSLNRHVTNAIAPYGTRVFGYSPLQIKQMLTGASPDQQGMFYAGYMLQPEMQAARVNAMSGRMSVKLIDEMTKRAIGNLKASHIHITPQVMKLSQNYANAWITDAFISATAVENPTPQNPFGLSKETQQTLSQQTGKGYVYNKSGQGGFMPSGQIKDAIASGQYSLKKTGG